MITPLSRQGGRRYPQTRGTPASVLRLPSVGQAPTGTQPPYQTRSGVCRAGACLAGLFKPSLVVSIGGSVVSPQPQYESFTITESLDGTPTTCVFTAQGYQPSVGQEVIVGYGHLDNRLFAGHIISIQFNVMGFETTSTTVAYTATCVDYSWMMDLNAVITKRYYQQDVNLIVADLLRNFTSGGFLPGYLAGLGQLAQDFTEVRVSDALKTIAKALGVYWAVDYRKRVHMFTNLPDANTLTITDSSIIENFHYVLDQSQLRNRVRVAGRAAQASALVPAGSATLPVNDTSPFFVSGGQALSGWQVLTYTGVTTASGPGSLTGVTGIVYDIGQGSDVRVFSQADDTTSQTNLAALLGGGFSGIATHYLSDTSASRVTAQAEASSQLSYFSTAIPSITYDIRNTRNGQGDQTHVGKTVGVTLTTPTSLSATFRVQRVEITLQAPVDNVTPYVEITRRVTAQRHYRTVIDILKQLNG